MKQKLGRKLLSFLLTLAMLVGLVPGMSLTALAEESAYNSYLVTSSDTAATLANKVVKFNNIDWYIIADDSTAANAGSVTLLAKGYIGSSKFAESSTDYSSSDVKGYLDNLITTGNNFAGVADAIVAVSLSDVNVTGAKLWLLSTDEANALPVDVRKDAGNWWLRNAHYDYTEHISYAAGVRYNGNIYTDVNVKSELDVRPALKLDLSKVSFDSATNTFSVVAASSDVTGVTLDKTTVQTIDVDGKVSFTATVEPDNATDKTVKWSVGGTDADAVKLYTDADCTTEVGTDATDKLTVYAKGISAGSATVTATSNADSEKKACCDVTVNAAQTQTEELLTTITATGKEQASYNPENVATVSFSYTAGGSSAYLANWGWWGYGWTATVNAAEGYTITKCVFYDDANRTATDSSSPFVVETTEEDKTPRINGTPIDGGNFQSKGLKKIEVYGYATPASSYSVTITPGDNMTKTAGSGDAEQTGLTGAMTDVVYTANDGYYFPEDYAVTAVNGISVTRDSYTQITVSGTPTADATITLTAPTEKSKETTPTATFTVTGAYDGTLSGVANGMKYSLNNGTTWTDVSSDANIELTGLSGCIIQVVKKGGNTTADSDPQEITVAQASKPTAVAAHCTSKDNNDGKITGITTEMEYMKSDATEWIPGTGSDITGLAPGTYYVRVKATDTTLASDNQELTIEPFERTNPFEGRVYNIGDVLYLSDNCVVNFQDGSDRNILWTAKTEDASYYIGKTYQIPTPTWNESREYWKFPDFTLVYYEGTWYDMSLLLGWTDDANGGEIVTGVKCTGGDGSWESPYTFALVYLPRVEGSAEGYSGTYDGASHGITVSVTDPISGTTVKYGTTEGTYNLDTSPEYTDAGEYTVYYEVTAEGRSALRGSADISIAKAEVTVTAKDQSIRVNGTVPDLSSPVLDTHYTVSGLVGEDTLTTTPTLAYQKNGEAATPDNTTAGTYDIVPSGASAGDNYSVSYVNGTLTISEKQPATVTKAPEAKTLTYNGQAQELVTAGTAEGGTMKYAVTTENTAPTDDNLYTTSIPTATNAGTYYVWYKVIGDSNHNDSTAKVVPVEIKKAEITVIADDKASDYLADLEALTSQISGGIVEADVDSLKSTYIHLSTNADKNQAGPYSIMVTCDEHPNYVITPVNGTYTVNKIGLTVSATGYSGEYDGKAHGITVDIGSSDAVVYYSTEMELDASNYSSVGNTAAPTRTDAGSTTVYYYVETKNYTPNPVYGNKVIEVRQAPVTVSGITAKDKEYDETTKAELDYSAVTLEGVLNQDLDHVAVTAVGTFDSAEAGEAKTVTISDLTLTGTGASNYVLAESGQQTETKAAITNKDSKTEGEVVLEATSDNGKTITSVTAASSSNVEAFAETLKEEGKEVKVELAIIPKKEDEVAKDSVAKIQDTVKEVFVGIETEKIKTEYLEIDLNKYVESAKEGQITDTKTPLEIALRVDTSKMGSPMIIRTHNGVGKAFDRLGARPSRSADYRDATYYVEAGNLYLYSQYFSDFAIVYVTEKAYEVTIENGVDSTFKRVVTEGSKVTPTISTTKEGYEFAGWYTDVALTKEWKVDTDTVTSDITLYAKWVKKEAPVTPAATEAKAESPKTGDTMPVSAVVVLMMVALAGGCVFSKRKRSI